MLRYAIIDSATGIVLNIVEYQTAPNNPPPGFEVGIIAVATEVADTRWTWDGTALVPPPAIAPPPSNAYMVPPVMVAAALGQVVTPASVDISNPTGTGLFNIVAAMYIDVGVYWFFFNVTEPDANYFAIITGTNGTSVAMTDHDIDFFALEAKDSAGNPSDLLALNVTIYRIAK